MASLPESIEELAEHTLLHMVGYEEGWSYGLNQVGSPHLEAFSNWILEEAGLEEQKARLELIMGLLKATLSMQSSPPVHMGAYSQGNQSPQLRSNRNKHKPAPHRSNAISAGSDPP